jgi:hypothetical protein
VISGRGSAKGALRSHVGLRSGAAKFGGLDAASREQDRLITPPSADDRIYGSKAAVFNAALIAGRSARSNLQADMPNHERIFGRESAFNPSAHGPRSSRWVIPGLAEGVTGWTAGQRQPAAAGLRAAVGIR